MNDESSELDEHVAAVLVERAGAAGPPLPWDSVMARSVPDAAPSTSTTWRWLSVAASLMLVVGAVVVLSSRSSDDVPAVTELAPVPLDDVAVDGVGPTRPLSSVVPGDAVVPTRLFRELTLEPVIVYDEWRSQWFAHSGQLDDSDVVIDVATGMDGEQAGTPDRKVMAGDVEWSVRSFGPAEHAAFARFDRLGVFVRMSGAGSDDLDVLLAGLRAADPGDHAAGSYDAERDGVEVTRSASGDHQLEAVDVGRWLCWSVRPIATSVTHAGCSLPAPAADGSMVLGSIVTSSPLSGDSDDLNSPRRSTVLTVGVVPDDAIGADIVHAEGPSEFARADDRSGRFDVAFVLGDKSFDELDGFDSSGGDVRGSVDLTPVFDD